MAQNVRQARFDPTFRQAVDPPEDDPERTRTQIKRGDLLLTIVGANTGDLCRVDFDPIDHFVCQSVALLRPWNSITGPITELYFASEIGRRLQMQGMIYGAGRPHLNFDQIRSLAVPVVPAEEAREIRVQLDATLSDLHTSEIEDTNITALRQAILAAAFRGELVQ
jgi:type I restriction enzyme S subunit